MQLEVESRRGSVDGVDAGREISDSSSVGRLRRLCILRFLEQQLCS
jgi:hypothetical protein